MSALGDALADEWRRANDNRNWTYFWLMTAIFILAVTVGHFFSVVTASDWAWDGNDYPLTLWISSGLTVVSAFMAGAFQKREHAPKATFSGVGGLVSVCIGAASFTAASSLTDPTTWLGLAGLGVTIFLLPFGWNSDAKLAQIPTSAAVPIATPATTTSAGLPSQTKVLMFVIAMVLSGSAGVLVGKKTVGQRIRK